MKLQPRGSYKHRLFHKALHDGHEFYVNNLLPGLLRMELQEKSWLS